MPNECITSCGASLINLLKPLKPWSALDFLRSTVAAKEESIRKLVAFNIWVYICISLSNCVVPRELFPASNLGRDIVISF